MKRIHYYCDACGTQISYIDSDGEVCIQGINSSGISININIKTIAGSSSRRVQSPSGDYCNYACFSKGVISTMHLVDKECERMKALE